MAQGTDSNGEGRGTHPLSAPVFNILLALSDGEEHHGYGIAKEVRLRTGGSVKLGPGTLYGAIKRMIGQGLIVEANGEDTQDREGGEDTEQGKEHGGGAHEHSRRYYKITGAGRQAAEAEAQRLESLVSTARDRGLLPGPAPIPEEV